MPANKKPANQPERPHGAREPMVTRLECVHAREGVCDARTAKGEATAARG